jgi:ATP-dependent RNA helicase RhlE
MLFSQLGLIDPIMKALQEEGYEKPTPIQEQAIPSILKQRDLLGCAQTGTGKTAAFSIPVLQLLSGRPAKAHASKPIRCLILTPTRELAIQINESIEAYGRHLKLKHAVIFGGVPQRPQTAALRQGVDILVATPGRLMDLVNQGFVHLQNIEVFILDEADRMLDMGFIHDVKRIVKIIPAKRQTLFFSATMPTEIQNLANSMLTDPIKVEVTPVSSTAETIVQSVYFVSKNDKRDLLNHILKDKSITSALVFTRTKHGADKVVKDLLKAGTSALAIHGNKAQNARQRALSSFKDGTTRVLVATDIAARGIDVDSLSHVVNYEIPNIPETYVHRIGRTGRAGASGIAFSFCEEEEKAYLKDIQKLINQEIPVNNQHAWAQRGGIPVELAKAPKKAAPAPRNKPRNASSSTSSGKPADHKHKSRPAQASSGQSSNSGNRPVKAINAGASAPKGEFGARRNKAQSHRKGPASTSSPVKNY